MKTFFAEATYQKLLALICIPLMLTAFGGWACTAKQQQTNLAGGFFDLDDLAALIVAAFGTRPVRQFAFVAVGTFGQAGRRQMIVGAALGRARLGMAPFRIRHKNLSTRPPVGGDRKL